MDRTYNLTDQEALELQRKLGANYTIEQNPDGTYNVIRILATEADM